MDANHTPHEIVGPEEVVREFRRASRAASTPPEVRVMAGRVLRELTKFEMWCEPLFDVDTPRVTKVVEAAAKLEEYAAFTLRIMRRAELGKPCPEVDDDGTVLASDEDIIREVVNALAACRRYFWSAKHDWAKATAKLEAEKLAAAKAEAEAKAKGEPKEPTAKLVVLKLAPRPDAAKSDATKLQSPNAQAPQATQATQAQTPGDAPNGEPPKPPTG